MGFETAVQQMFILAVAIAFGFVARKLKLMNDQFDTTLSKLILSITMPCMIIGAVICRSELPDTSAILAICAYSWLAYALILVIAVIVPRLMRLEPSKRGAYSFMVTFANVGFIGFPVCGAIFGETAILYAAIFNIPFNVLVFTVGILMLSSNGESGQSKAELLKGCVKNLKSPCLIACIIALILSLLNVCNTGIVGEAIAQVGNMTTPAALLIVGSSIAKAPFATLINQVRPYILAFIRLLFVPIVVWLVFRNVINDPIILGVLVVTSGMPVASNGTLISLLYGGDMDSIARGTFLTTILSLVTIPILVAIVI